ncbi:MAG TPA: DUF4404 family protein [Pseudomonadales bacterium]|nr:DUF4404 family protein [Pseudomonadales bacterium]
MPRDRLHEALNTLHRELDDPSALSENDHALLAKVAEDVQRVLEEVEPDDSIRTRVETLATEFEANNPRTALLLSEIVELLQRMGI